jgi:hypothetical protein
MFKSLGHWFRQSFGLSKHDKAAIAMSDQTLSINPMTESFDAMDAPSHFVPYDENLLERARTQWQFGDWESLARLERDTLQHHPDRAKLALLAAAGHLQQGDSQEARQFTRMAQDWGCSKKLVSQILISGVHNSLGRAGAIGNQEHRALRHFETAITIGTAGSDTKLLTKARVGEQLSQLRIASAQISQHEAVPTSSSTLLKPPSFKVTTLATHNLGEAWAGNTINTVIFRHHGILTHNKTQYTAFYVDTHTLRLVQRDLVTDALKIYDLPGEYNLRDAHNSISLGLDRQDHLHISYDHHATQLRYRRSINPGDITAWSDELLMTGVHEEKVTYPTFILPRHNFPLTLLYRDGVHNKGTARLKTYDEAKQVWSDHPQAILSGSEQKPWTSNAYWNHPVTGTDGSLHLSFVWRIQGMGDENVVNNTNIGYACSFDNGNTWQTSHGHPYKLPITQVNAETVYPVAPGSNLINQCSMALDSFNRPHIVFYADDANGIPQYQHLRFDGKVWQHAIVSQRAADFELLGAGTLQIPFSRPEIVLDSQDNAYLIYRGDLSKDRMTATMLAAPDYRWQADIAHTLWPEHLGYAEPIIDRSRWPQDHTLTLLLQANEQPNHDTQHQAQQRTVTLVDLQFN